MAFAGEPPPGHLYYGASLPFYRSLPAWETRLGARLSLHRSYFEADEIRQLAVQCRADLRRGRFPHVSIKAPGAWADVAAGRRDDWLVRLVRAMRDLGRPVFLTINHEPENEAGGPGMTADDYTAMQRRAIDLAGQEAPQTSIVPVLQTWTFDPMRTDATPEAWIVPEAQVFGIDVYNPWSPRGGKPWRSFGSRMDEVSPWIDGKPVAIGEYGCRLDPLLPARTAQWLIEAVDYARRHRIVSMSYFNSDLNSPDGTWELSGEPEDTFAELLRSPWVVRP